MQVKVGSFVQSLVAAPSTQVITGVGFQPKALILWTTGGTVDGTFRVGARFGIGFSTGVVEQVSISFSSSDNVTPTAAGRQPFARAISIASPTTGAVALAYANLVSFDADGFTLSWVVNDAAGYIINYMALGAGVSAKAHAFYVPVVAGKQSITGIGFRPDLVILASTLGASVGVAAADAAVSLGAMDGLGGQAAVGLYDVSAVNPSDTQRIQLTDSVVVGVNAALALTTQAQYSSMDSDGYTLNWINVTAPTPCHMAAIAVQCGGRAKVSFFTKAVGAPPAAQVVTGVGFSPEGLLLFSNMASASGAGAAQGRIGIGAVSAVGGGCIAFAGAANIVNPSSIDALGKSAVAFVKVNNNTPVIDAECTLTSFDTDGYTLNWTTNDGVTTQVLYIALASAVPTGWTYESIGTAKAGPDALGVAHGVRAYTM